MLTISWLHWWGDLGLKICGAIGLCIGTWLTWIKCPHGEATHQKLVHNRGFLRQQFIEQKAEGERRHTHLCWAWHHTCCAWGLGARWLPSIAVVHCLHNHVLGLRRSRHPAPALCLHQQALINLLNRMKAPRMTSYLITIQYERISIPLSDYSLLQNNQVVTSST